MRSIGGFSHHSQHPHHLLDMHALSLLLSALAATAFAVDTAGHPLSARAIQTSWKSAGCVVDGAARALEKGPYGRSPFSVAQCQNICAGYKYAGTEGKFLAHSVFRDQQLMHLIVRYPVLRELPHYVGLAGR